MNVFRVIFVGILVVFQSCIYSKITHLSDEDLEWVDVYDVGDTITFISNLGNTDVMTVTKKFLYNDRCPFYISTGRVPNYNANTGYGYIIKHDRISIDGGLLLIKNLADSLDFIIDLGSRISRFDKRNLEGPLKTRMYEHNNKTYSQCIIADSTNSGYSEYWDSMIKNKVEKFVWSKEHGLIYYKFEDGEEFFRRDLLPDSILMKNQL